VWIRIQVYPIAEISDVVQTRVVVDETQWDDERRQPALVVDDDRGEVAAGLRRTADGGNSPRRAGARGAVLQRCRDDFEPFGMMTVSTLKATAWYTAARPTGAYRIDVISQSFGDPHITD